MTATSLSLDEHISRILLRFFRAGEYVTLTGETLRLAEDLEYLYVQWALSSQIEDLLRHLLENRHEAQASMETNQRDGSATIRGRLCAARTIMRRRLTGDVSQVSYQEPKQSFKHGPNHTLTWVLRFSEHILQRYLHLLSGSIEYSERARRIFGRLAAIRHLKGIGEAVTNTNLRVRPSVKSIIQTGKARKRLYRKAFDAYQALLGIESGNSEATVKLLNGSLIGPLADWQKFELLVALKLSECTSSALGEELILHPIQPGADRPIASFGPCDVYWQSRTEYQRFPELEPSERVTNEILRSYGMPAGWDRPDIVICHRTRSVVVAIAEAKFSASGSDTWKDSFREAASQLVRYSRLYTHCAPRDELLRRSFIAISNLPDEIRNRPAPLTSPVAAGMDDVISGALDAWTDRVVTFVRSLASVAA